jgi:hypothetical protein
MLLSVLYRMGVVLKFLDLSPRHQSAQTNQLSITTTLQINLDGVYGCILYNYLYIYM